jgi:Domain of unknown function (DUF4136)
MKALTVPVAALAVMWVAVGSAAVKVQTQFDKTFDFSKVRSWAWNDKGAGQVLMARTADDNSEAVRQMVEPIIKDAVAAELPGRGVQPSVAGATPDSEVTYYLFVTVGTQTQQMGQFLPAIPDWGLPPLAGPAQTYKIVQEGSLVLDISANNEVVWRGLGQAEVKPGTTPDKRNARIREAVRDILKKYPPKK